MFVIIIELLAKNFLLFGLREKKFFFTESERNPEKSCDCFVGLRNNAFESYMYTVVSHAKVKHDRLI